MFSSTRISFITTTKTSNPIRNRLFHTTSRLLASKPTTTTTTQVDIRTSQPLRKLSERRYLLSALQRFGEVARFVAVTDDRISATYDTPEAASRAINASPLTILLPIQHSLNASQAITIHCDIATGTNIAEHDETPINNNHNRTAEGYYYKNRRDPRVADVVRAGIPRWEFADCLLTGVADNALQDESEENTEMTLQKGEIEEMSRHKREMEDLISRRSLMALMEK